MLKKLFPQAEDEMLDTIINSIAFIPSLPLGWVTFEILRHL